MYKYQQIAQSLHQMFTDGTYAPGALLPDQEQLAKQFHTTRITIRKAIQLLIVEGVVYSKRGAGTFLRKDYRATTGGISPIDQPLGTTATQPGHKVTSKILGFAARMPNESEQEALVICPTDPVYVIDRVRYVDQQLFSYEHTIMPTAIMTITEDMLKGSIYAALKAHGIAIAGSHRTVYAIKATEEDVKAIGAALNDPVLVIRQVSYSVEGEPFEFSESHFPYENASVTADIELDPRQPAK
ncbi:MULTISPECIES: GntR family transcriptional regulator [Lacticaseibacillus]|uniref:GntR family transcriptional regulator n=1 Tax=Lacticaseibacillus hegangensis TaxID=2486010 RepID=A0ABW4CU65_9LACO|nr:MULTISPECIES: GntR family transcriptional regulator [Lacticaseibacillus]